MNMLAPLAESIPNWSDLVEKYESSGLTQHQFCIQHSLSHPTFKYQRNKLKIQAKPKRPTLPSSPTLVPITLTPKVALAKEMANTVGVFKLQFDNGIRCQIPLSIEANKLKALLEALHTC